MKQGQMITAMAKLEGIDLIWHRNMHLRKDRQGNFCINGVTMGVYNPLENHTLTFKAMVDYDVKIDGLSARIVNDNGIFFSMNQSYLSVPDVNLLAYAIIECILKSKGLWEENEIENSSLHGDLTGFVEASNNA